MRVLAFEGWPTLLAGGQERSLFEVICGLRDRDVAVTLAYEDEGELLSEYRKRGVATIRIKSRILILKSWRVVAHAGRFLQSLLGLLAQSRRAGGRWTLIYINQYFDVTLAVVCGAILRIPVVCHLRLAAPPYLSRQMRWGLRRCRLLICNSAFTAKTYVDAGFSEQSIVVVRNAIDTNVFSPAESEDIKSFADRPEKVILYVGRISPEKGIEVLIDAMVIARRRQPGIRLLIVGNARGHGATGAYMESLRTHAEGALGEAVSFRPATSDIVALYRNADLTVLPSVWDEPFGRVVIESMACGVPCLASRAGGIPEILGGELEELLFDKGNPADLAAKMVTFINWRWTRPALANLCRQRVVRQFSSVAMSGRLYELLGAVEAAN
jgi:glycosyltransferase involved in cell wall biosynthesis